MPELRSKVCQPRVDLQQEISNSVSKSVREFREVRMRLLTALRGISGRIVALLSSLVISLPAFAGTFINFDVPGAVYTIAYGINNSGDAAGYWSDGTAAHGFLRRVDGTITSFDISRGTQPSPMAINSSGTIAGYYFGTDNAYHGFLRNLSGGLTTINAPGAGWKNFGGTYALSINDAGQVAGFYVDNGGTEHGFFRDASGNYSTCDPPGSVNTLGLMLNQAGELVGNYYTADTLIHGFLRDAAGNITVFDAGGAGLYAWTVAINASGQISGYYYDHSSNGGHGFLRNPDG